MMQSPSDSDRRIGYAPRTTTLARDLAALPGPCVGCPGCQGLCMALVDTMTVPDIVLGRRSAPL